tara:strand:+ start:31 stop:528 length:498 start_codon:yes stop_codon:yes gene_type:complete
MESFTEKVRQIFTNPEFTKGKNPICRWNDDNSIEIFNITNFEKKVLQKYFKTKIFKSFSRQLSNYQFIKIKNKPVWHNEKFTKSTILNCEKKSKKRKCGSVEDKIISTEDEITSNEDEITSNEDENISIESKRFKKSKISNIESQCNKDLYMLFSDFDGATFNLF